MSTEVIVSLVVSVFASSGLWSLITFLIQRREEKKNNLTKLVLGLAYDKIVNNCMKYIKRGSITKDEYEDLIKYLYKPYVNEGGDGTAERLVAEVGKLPIVPGEIRYE